MQEEGRPGQHYPLRSVVIIALSEALPGLREDDIGPVLDKAQAAKGNSLRNLAQHLAEHPGALTSGDPRCPAVVIRVAHAFHDAGYTAVVRPGCAGCGKVTIGLARSGPDGRLCTRCATKAEPRRPCARCGRTRRISARRPEGGICSTCYAKDPQVAEPCGKCGRRRVPATRAADGTALCQSCYRRPLHTCATCGNLAPAHASTKAGPVCKHCYQAPRRRCGSCGQVRRISKRATASSPDLCFNCYPGPEAICVICARTRPCHRNARGLTVCRTCRPRPSRECCRCERSRPVHAEWPIGPVCRSCYDAIRSTPLPCARCDATRSLIGINNEGKGICGTCAGAKTDYSCRNCGQGRPHYADGLCATCVLADRLRDLLADSDGLIPPALMPVFATLVGAEPPKTMISWCRRSPTARLLARLAAENQPLTHSLLDELPQDSGLHFARQVLVHTGVLPERAEYLERIGPWIDKTLAGHPVEHARIVRPYAHWTVLRRARRRAASRPYTSGAARSARRRIAVALQFLSWLDQHGLTLKTLQQADVDNWLTTGPTTRNKIRYFLAWTHSHDLTGHMTVPSRPHEQTADLLDEDERYQQLHRCLFDKALPLDVHVAGALVLVFGASLTKIVQLTAGHITSQKYAKRDWAAYVAERVDDTCTQAGARNRAPQE